MNEDEWLNMDDSRNMMDFLKDDFSERKQRLFACACLRNLSASLITKKELRLAISNAEDYCYGKISPNQLRASNRTATELSDDSETRRNKGILRPGWGQPLDYNQSRVAHLIALTCEPGHVSQLLARQFIHWTYYKDLMNPKEQCNIIREIIGNPFADLRSEDWLPEQWFTPLVKSIAKQCYEERDFTGCLILADALEDEGCSNYLLLDHLRENTEHLLGCFAIDAILGY